MPKYLICLLLFSSFFASAQELSMHEAMELARKNNRTLQNASADIQIARQKRLETIADGLPQISASAGYLNYPNQPVSVVPAEFFGGTPGTYTSLTFGLSQSATAGLMVEQVVFDGSYIVGLQAAQTYLQISEQAFIKSEQQVVTTTVESYVNALVAQAQLKVLEQNLVIAERNYSDVLQLYENGLTEEENVEQIGLTVASLKSSVHYSQNMVRITKGIVHYIVGLPYDKPLVLTTTLEELTLRAQKEALGDFRVAQNIDFLIAENDIEANRLLLKLERAKALPRISAFASGGYDGFGETFDFFSAQQDWYPRTAVGLNINFPVFSSFKATAKKQQAKLALEKSKRQSEDVVQRLLLEETSLRNEVQLYLKNIHTSSESLALATRIEQKNQIKFKEGMVSGYTLRQAQIQLYQAQNNYLTAMQQLVLAKAKLSLLLTPITPNNK